MATFKFTLKVDELKNAAAFDEAELKQISPTHIAHTTPIDLAFEDAKVDLANLEVRVPVYGREAYITLNAKNPEFEVSTEDSVADAWYERLVAAMDGKIVAAEVVAETPAEDAGEDATDEGTEA